VQQCLGVRSGEARAGLSRSAASAAACDLSGSAAGASLPCGTDLPTDSGYLPAGRELPGTRQDNRARSCREPQASPALSSQIDTA